MKPIAAYREFGEDSEFLNDCLATQIETIIQELEKGGRSDPRFLSLMKSQTEPQNQTSVELEKGPKGPWTHIDFMSLWNLKMVLKNETARELKGGTWRTPELNVMYSVHCTVQYHAGAINEDKAGFSTVITEANAGDNESEDKFADTDTEKNLMADVLKTKVHDRNCMGTHLTPHLKYYSNMLDESQIADDVYEIEGDDFNDVDFDFNDFEHTHGIDPGARGGPSVLDVTFRLLTPAVSLLSKAVSQQLNPASRTLSRLPGLEQSIPRKGNQDIA